MKHMRIEDVRSERRILKNRIRRQQEMKKNFLIFLMTLCLVVLGSVSLSGFRSTAKSDSIEASYKYYKSITVANDDTLWSIAEKYMDEDHYESIYDYINEVKSMNSMTDDVIHYGEHLIVPYYDTEFAG
ncbi:MAG: LysM peptidoglycan-binding domain-containing protein [Eubacterium sp.]|nr:LysM peptidoglycan-binding domain-containing protein [Eubacterium sp.]